VEAAMSLQDRLIAETSEAMNALESGIYQFRDDLSQKLAAFVAEEAKEKLSAMLTQCEDWLYDEGYDCEKSVYVAKRQELVDAFAPIVARCSESEKMPGAVDEFKAAIARFAGFAADTSDAFAHISAEEKEKVAAEVTAAETFLTDAEAKIAVGTKTADAEIKAADVEAKMNALISACKPTMDKPKPPPPKEEAPAEPEAPAEGGEPAPAAADGEAPAKPPEPDNMDVD